MSWAWMSSNAERHDPAAPFDAAGARGSCMPLAEAVGSARPARTAVRRCSCSRTASHAEVARGSRRPHRGRWPPRSASCRPRTSTAPRSGRSRPCARRGSSRRRPGRAAWPRAARGRAQKPPMPLGPSILWPVNPTKSASHACHVDRASAARPGQRRRAPVAPAAWPASARARTSLTVPRTLDIAVKAKSLAPSSRRSSSRESRR